MFINTAILTLIINARLKDFIPSLKISNIIPALHDYMDKLQNKIIKNSLVIKTNILMIFSENGT